MRWVSVVVLTGGCALSGGCAFRAATLAPGSEDGPVAADGRVTDGGGGGPDGRAGGRADARTADGPPRPDGARGSVDARRADAATPPRPDAAIPDAARPDATVLRCPTSSKGLMACWDFQDDGTDGAGGGHDATLSNVTFGPGQVGSGLVSSSANVSRAFVAPAADFEAATAAVTIEAWIKPAAVPSAPGLRAGIFDTDGQWSIFLYGAGTDPGGMVRCSVAGGSTLFGGTIVAGTAYHLACVYDATSATTTLYIDGAPVVATSQSMPSPIVPTQASSEIGGNAECLAAPCTDVFTGTIDDVRIWSTARTAVEIAADAAE